MKLKQTEIGEIPEGWEVARLIEVTEKISSGATPKGGKESYGVTGLSLIRSQNVLNEGFSRSGLAFIDEKQAKELDNVTVISKDVLLNITGDSVARSCMVPDNVLPARVNQHVLIIRSKKDKLHPLWLRYFLIEPKTQQRLFSLASSGATRQALTKGMIEGLLIPFPSLTEQGNLTKILSDIDAKIELNHQMNKTLESIAQTLFKQWFVDFEFPGYEKMKFLNGLPNGWRIEKMANLVDTVSVTHKFKDNKIIFLNTSDILNGEVLHQNYSDVSTLPGQAKKSVRINDILYSEIRPENKRFAYVDFEADDYVVSTKLMVLRTKGNVHPLVIYYFLKNEEIINELQMLAESRSGTFPQITFEHIRSLEMVVPDKEILDLYTKILTANFIQISQNSKEIRCLSQIRDSLLPMLMSGAMKVEV